jgi:hypothetical protein
MTFWRAFVGAMLGKLIITIFIAACAFFGFGPDRWIALVMGVEPSLVILARIVLVGTGLATFLVLVGPWIRHQLGALAWLGPSYEPLPSVARRLYEATLGTAIAEFAKNSSDTPDEILGWYAFWAVQKGLPIYGKRPPSSVMELIPQLTLGGSVLFSFKAGAAELLQDFGSPLYVDLAVKRADLRRAWTQLTTDTGTVPTATR